MVFSDSFSELIEKNQKSGVYVIDNSYFKKDFDVLSGGLVYKVVPKNDFQDYQVKKINEDFWNSRDLRFLENKNFDKEYWNQELVHIYTASLNNFAAWLFNAGNVEESIKYFEKSLEIRENQNALYNLWGINNAIGKEQEAGEYKERFEEL